MLHARLTQSTSRREISQRRRLRFLWVNDALVLCTSAMEPGMTERVAGMERSEIRDRCLPFDTPGISLRSMRRRGRPIAHALKLL